MFVSLRFLRAGSQHQTGKLTAGADVQVIGHPPRKDIMQNLELIRPISELLARNVNQRGDRTAFRDETTSRTWQEIDTRTFNLAGHLTSAGVVGSTVCIILPNIVETVESYLAIVRSGAIAVCLNSQAGDSELAYMIADANPSHVITESSQIERLTNLIVFNSDPDTSPKPSLIVVDDDSSRPSNHTSSRFIAYETLTSRTPASAPLDSTDLDRAAFMLYTSGTTGRPKGVLLSERSCLWVVAACWAPSLSLTADDEILCPLPLFHSYALSLCVLAPLAIGCSERIMPTFSPKQTLHWLSNEAITILPGVPTMFDYLLRSLDDRPLLSTGLRVCVSAGAIMPAALNQEFETSTSIPLLDGYGITETSTMVTMNWLNGSRPSGSCGLPVPGCAVRLVVIFGEVVLSELDQVRCRC